MTDTDVHELEEPEQIVAAGGSAIEVRTLCRIACGARRLPLHAISLGNPDPAVPEIGIIGGVHGLERIGAQVALAFLHSVVSRLRRDTTLQRQLEHLRLVFVPVVNPGGMWRRTRANPNGVDLMRNALLDAVERPPFLIGGHRLGPQLPWYRGPLAGPLEAESAALCQLVDEELLGHRFSMAVDCHSGFGVHDRIWFPYARTAQPIPHLADMHALMEILDQTHSHHRYVFEPRSRQYLAHGDLWDYLCLRALERSDRVFLPLTLEMGSWLWVKKNPRQLFSRHGMFNPLIEHRRQRVLRRHLVWLDFMTRAASGSALWLPQGKARESHRSLAMQRWYGGAGVSAAASWVLLRGLTRETRHWGNFPQRLGEAFPGAPVICLDLPGNGKLNGMESPPGVEAMADCRHAEIAQLGIAAPCRVLAMSLGAMVTVAWAQRHPDDVAAAVLINTSLRPFSPFYRRLRPANYLRLLRLFAAKPSDRELETAVLEMTTRLQQSPAAVIDAWLQWRRETPVSRRNALRQRPLERLLLLWQVRAMRWWIRAAHCNWLRSGTPGSPFIPRQDMICLGMMQRGCWGN